MSGILVAVKNVICEIESTRLAFHGRKEGYFSFSILILLKWMRRREVVQTTVLSIEGLNFGSSILV